MFLKAANSSILCRKPATNWYFPQQAFLIFSYVWQQWDYAQLFRLMCLRRKNKHHTYHYPKCSRIAASSLQFCCIRSDFLYDIESSLWFLSPARENYTKECFSLFFLIGCIRAAQLNRWLASETHQWFSGLSSLGMSDWRSSVPRQTRHQRGHQSSTR